MNKDKEKFYESFLNLILKDKFIQVNEFVNDIIPHLPYLDTLRGKTLIDQLFKKELNSDDVELLSVIFDLRIDSEIPDLKSYGRKYSGQIKLTKISNGSIMMSKSGITANLQNDIYKRLGLVKNRMEKIVKPESFMETAYCSNFVLRAASVVPQLRLTQENIRATEDISNDMGLKNPNSWTAINWILHDPKFKILYNGSIKVISNISFTTQNLHLVMYDGRALYYCPSLSVGGRVYLMPLSALQPDGSDDFLMQLCVGLGHERMTKNYFNEYKDTKSYLNEICARLYPGLDYSTMSILAISLLFSQRFKVCIKFYSSRDPLAAESRIAESCLGLLFSVNQSGSVNSPVLSIVTMEKHHSYTYMARFRNNVMLNDEILARLPQNKVAKDRKEIPFIKAYDMAFEQAYLNPTALFSMNKTSKGVHSLPMKISDATIDRDLPEVEMDIDNEREQIVFTIKTAPNCDSVIGDSIYGEDNNETKYIISTANMSKVCHEFTFSIFGTDDVKFMDVGLINGVGDNMSPDFLYVSNISNGGIRVLVSEFGTTMGSAKSYFEEKMEKYMRPLKSKSETYNCSIEYVVLVVNEHGINHNSPSMNSKFINELVYRYRVSRKMYNLLREMNLVKDSIEEDKAISEIRNLLSANSINWENNLLKPITMDHINSFKETMNPIELATYEENLLKDLPDVIMEVSENLIKISDLNKSGEMDSYNSKLISEMTQSYWESVPDIDTRSDMKAVVQVPLLIQIPNSEILMSEDLRRDDFLSTVIDSDDATLNAWIQACFDRHYNTDDITLDGEIALAHIEPKDQFWTTEKLKPLRSKFKRVKVKLSINDSIDLAKLGVQASKYKQDIRVQAYRKAKSAPFSKYTNTDDIQNFIDHECISIESQLLEPLVRDFSLNSIIKRAQDVHNFEDSKTLRDLSFEFLRTKIGRYCSLISDIGTEIAVSLPQNCQKDEYIMKPLKHHPVDMLIKPTNLNSKIFFSLRFKSKDYEMTDNTLFKNASLHGDYYITDFISLDLGRLQNWIRLESLALALFVFWLEFYQVFWFDKPVLDLFKKDSRVYKMLWFCIILALNDKHYVEEVITNMRYIYMEAFSSSPEVPRPEKMFEKFPLYFKDRLELHMVKRSILLIDNVKRNKTTVSVEHNNFIMKGLKNPFLGKDELDDLTDQDQMLNLMYLGYLHNKDTSAEDNAVGQMIQKIMGWETKAKFLDESRLGIDEPTDFKELEYSPKFVKLICANALHLLKTRHGQDPKKLIEDSILRYLSRELLEEFATLKASSNFGEMWYVYSNKMKYKRAKVVEKLVEYLEENKNPDCTKIMHLLSQALGDLYKHKGLHVCIFKKNQHGGLREIYVLDLPSRIVQKVIESMSKAISLFFPSETMVHPKNKFDIPRRHYEESKRTFAKSFSTFAVSADAKKWNQGHHVSKFMLMLIQLTPTYMHGTIIKILQLWHHKKIMIPLTLIEFFDSHRDTKLYDEILDQVRDAYLGRISVPWMKPGSTYIETTTGMMQGILHYTSSLYHTLYQEFLNKTFSTHIPRLLMGVSQRIIINCMQSSDDSAMIVSIQNSEDKDQHALNRVIVSSMFKLKAKWGLKLGIYDSIKTTSMMYHCLEFNSEFFFLYGIHRPTFRWVNSAIMLSDQDTFVDRMRETHTSLTDINRGGGAILATAMYELASALLHYRSMGSTVSDAWPLMSKRLCSIPDPALGFFPLSHPLAAGVTDFDYNLWLLCSKTPLGLKYSKMLSMEYRDKTIDKKAITLETISISTFTKLSLRTGGDRKRYDQLTERLGMDSEWIQKINENPYLLYRSPENKEELQQKMRVKVSSPGFRNSVVKSNYLTRTISQSVYALTRAVFSSNISYVGSNKGENIVSKTTLCWEAAQSNIELRDYIDTNVIELNKVILSFHKWQPQGSISIDKILQVFISFLHHDLKNELLDGNNESINTFRKAILNLFGPIYNEEDWIRKCASFFSVNVVMCGVKEEEIFVNTVEDIIAIRINQNGTFDYAVNVLENSPPIQKTMSPEEELFFFPMLSDYITIHQNLQSSALSFKLLCPMRTMRGRSTTKIIISGAENMNNLRLEDLVRWKWWNKPRRSDIIEVLELEWTRIKSKIKWLRDTCVETLEASPFIDQIQLRTFIARRAQEVRSVVILGSGVKSHFGVTTMTTLIRDNASNCASFKAIEDETAKEIANSYETLLHISSMIGATPLNQQKKLAYVSDLLISCDDIITNYNMTRSKRTRLSVLKELLLDQTEMICSPLYTKNEVINACREIWVKSKSISEDEHTSFVFDNDDEDLDEEQILYAQKCFSFDYDVYLDELLKLYVPDEDDLYLFLVSKKGTNLINVFMRNPVDLCTIDRLKEAIQESRSAFPMIVDKIANLRIGCYGYYEVAQKFMNGRYEGPGVWVGRFDDVVVNIHVNTKKDTTYISKICVSKHEKDTFYNYLREWCSQNDVDNSIWVEEKLEKGAQIIGKVLNFSRTGSSETACPLVLDEKLLFYQDRNPMNIRLDLDHNALRLKALMPSKVGNRTSNVTILSIGLGSNVVNMRAGDTMIRDFVAQGRLEWPEWLWDWVLWRSSRKEDSPTSMATILTNIGALSDQEEAVKSSIRDVDPEEFKRWVHNLWMNTVRRRRLIKPLLQRTQAEPLQPETTPDFMLSIYSQMNDMASQMEHLMDKVVESIDTMMEPDDNTMELNNRLDLSHPILEGLMDMIASGPTLTRMHSNIMSDIPIDINFQGHVKLLQFLYNKDNITCIKPYSVDNNDDWF
uniref:RNA-directed RNA polymerase L n=1 Tax=Soybean thrips associated tenui-like virus 1 TaxID=2805428 RepID=A0A7U0R6W0_9VIRU|nr:RNA-dependent RNA polymerase [Soybean thrips associated tenui-like virus 1]